MKTPLKRYITPDDPFGPIDSIDIDTADTEALKKLFETHNQVYQSMRHRPSIIMGRRGSGKTSYLRTVYFNGDYDFIVEIRAQRVFEEITMVVQRAAKDAYVESLAELWEMMLWVCVFSKLSRESFLPPDQMSLVNVYLASLGVRDAVSVDDVLLKMAGVLHEVTREHPSEGILAVLRRFDRVAFDGVKAAVSDSLTKARKKFVILMDSLEDFRLDVDAASHALRGLLKFVGSMNKPGDVVDIRFCLPTELYRRVADFSSNQNKDFRRALRLQWKASELILVGALRLKLYLELYHPEFLSRLLPLDVSKRSDARRLFDAVLPLKITNAAGFEEDTISYILRHTQLLPRHFLMLLNSIFRNSGDTDGSLSFPIRERRIVNGVRRVEEQIVKEIFGAFRLVHPTAEETCRRCLPALGHKFDSGELHRVYNRHGKGVFGGESVHDLRRMLQEIGAVGRVDPSKSANVYIQGDFEYNVEHEVAIAPQDEMCLHPLFSGIYRGNQKERPVYPTGCRPDDEAGEDMD
ncbi:MAG: hypothetical protein Kow0070_22920 [Anaerolineales bacterium]